ncbi:MAG: phosphoribosyltransferase [Acetobacteraceae bacterium]|nr:phosphoribosyltransferase [Acetobacteraceae bacterium]
MREAAMIENREAAGRDLAARLAPLAAERPVVLALPRGGVPVAAPIAAALGVRLDILLVRKLGAPGQPELAVGAVVDGDPPQMVLNDDIVAAIGIGSGWIMRERERQLDEIARRRALLLGGRPPPRLQGRTVVLVDDGVATGATVSAALQAVSAAGAARVVLAVPVIAADVAARFRARGVEVIALLEPTELGSVGAFYQDFHQLSDAEVLRLLHPPEE